MTTNSSSTSPLSRSPNCSSTPPLKISGLYDANLDKELDKMSFPIFPCDYNSEKKTCSKRKIKPANLSPRTTEIGIRTLKTTSTRSDLNPIFSPLDEKLPSDKEIRDLFTILPSIEVDFKGNEFTQAKKNKSLNRYGNVLPYDGNIFSPDLYKNKELSSYFLNASIISYSLEGKELVFVAAQGPLSNTLNEFWKAVVVGDIKTIINLTMAREKHQEKCFDYWSTRYWEGIMSLKITDHQEILGEIRKTHDTKNYSEESKIKNQSLVERTFEFFPNNGDNSQTITQHHYEEWPDSGIPSEELFNQLLNKIKPSFDSSPIFVHCSAGIGRSGVVIATLIARQIVQAQLDCGEEHPQVNIIDIVTQMRNQRPGMLQNWEQLKAVYVDVARFAKSYKKPQ